jgi:hypothetical protein
MAMRSLAGGEPAQQLDALARMPANRLRDTMCRNAIKALAEKDSEAAEAHLDLLPEPRQRALLRADILGKLAERDPSAGLARLAELAPDLTLGTVSSKLVTLVLRAAAQKDPNAALAVIKGIPEDLRTQAVGAALVGWAGEHPIDALTWAAGNGFSISETRTPLFLGESAGIVWQSLLGMAFQRDREKTLAWLRAQLASPERDAMLSEGIWSHTPDGALQIYEDLSAEGRAVVASRVVQSSLPNGNDSVVQWIKTQPEGAARKHAIWAHALIQAGNSPERIETLADDWPAGPDRDAALRGIVWSLSQNDARRGLDFARRISGGAARESAFENIARSWLSRDRAAARAWVTGAPELSAEQKRVLLREFDER